MSGNLKTVSSSLSTGISREEISRSSDLEQILVYLTQYGKPGLSHLGSGWYCKVNMHVSSVGVEFTIASEFGNSTPITAVKECVSRLHKALDDLK